jgi:ferric-dicitrate binding protein FerR (iron transport regulator)
VTTCARVRTWLAHADGRVVSTQDAPLLEHLQACAACASMIRGLLIVDRALDAMGRKPAPPAPSFDALRAKASAAALSRRRRVGLRKLLPSIALALCSATVAMIIVGFAERGDRQSRARGGDVLEATVNARSAVLHSGARFVLESGSLRIAEGPHEERLRLESGVVSVEVPPLAAPGALSVETADAEVRAHGTRFRVEHSAEGTRVFLSEGEVSIHPTGRGRETLVLRAGESSLIEPLASYRERQRMLALAGIGEGSPDHAASALQHLFATEPDGALAAQAHALMGLVEQSRGHSRAAAEEYRRALAATTAGTLLWADNAAAELALLEERRSHHAGAAAWRAYLGRFPAGAHRALAGSRLARLRRH